MTRHPTLLHAAPDLAGAIEGAAARIAPAWPLESSIAVSPWWGFVGTPLPLVGARLASLAGLRTTMPRSWYRDQLARGAFSLGDLHVALGEAGEPLPLSSLREELTVDPPPAPVRASLTSLLAQRWDRPGAMGWRDLVVQNVSTWCAAWYDRRRLPAGDLFSGWRESALLDPFLGRWGGLRDQLRALPTDAAAAIGHVTEALGVPLEQREAWFTALLLDQNGWASACAWRRWTARQRGEDDLDLVRLLAIRVSWEWIAWHVGGPELQALWPAAVADWPEVDRRALAAHRVEWVLQRAAERGFEEDLRRRLRAAPPPAAVAAPVAEIVSCIDVRSEVFRRALEQLDPRLRTRGFAGFFGLPIAYTPAGAFSPQPRLPGPLAPKLMAVDAHEPAIAGRRRRRVAGKGAWRDLRRSALGAFPYVEAAGLWYASRLLTDALGVTRPAPEPGHVGLTADEVDGLRPRLDRVAPDGGDEVKARIDLARSVLRAMGLVGSTTPLVVLLGHAASTVNNPLAASLACGACCGRSGEVNARALASLLREPAVREGLREEGVLPSLETTFVAGVHDTVTDEVRLYDLDELPAGREGAVAQVRAWVSEAGRLTRAERSPGLGVEAADDAGRLRQLRRRAADWGEVRPEWGLAGNAAIVFAPRERFRGADLAGRAFLHDYDHASDPDGSVLELLLTAPMVVAHWINAQYHASTVEPRRFGSGDKVLHDVVAGGLGVFEGDGGDLRVGLPLQSVHDGREWRHAPLRLLVVVAAPAEAIERVLRAHPTVAALADGWVHLRQWDADGRWRAWRDGRWSEA